MRATFHPLRLWRSTHAFTYRYEREQVSRQLQDGRQLQTRIYELDERCPEGPQGWRRETAGQIDETADSSHEDELKGHARTVEDLSDHNHSILPDIRHPRLRPRVDRRGRLLSISHSVRISHIQRGCGSTLPILLVPDLLLRNQRSTIENIRSISSILNDPDRRR